MTELGTNLEIVPSGDGFALAGEIDAHTAPSLGEALDGTDSTSVTLDMSGVSFMDSSGLRVIITATERLRERGGDLVLAKPTSTVRRLVDVAGLSEHFTISD